MVRLAGLRYSMNPAGSMGSRIGNLELGDGTPLDASKHYKVAGWATVGAQSEGPPVWEQVSEYLRQQPTLRVDKLTTPRLIGVADNPGMA